MSIIYDSLLGKLRTTAGGTPGPKGDKGADGRTILTTSGKPSNAVGANGDYAYDPTACVMYGPKTDGAWPDGVSLVGEVADATAETKGILKLAGDLGGTADSPVVVTGTEANNIVRLDSEGRLPAVDASLLTGLVDARFPTADQKAGLDAAGYAKIAGASFDFDGLTYINFGASPDLSDGFTFSCWVKDWDGSGYLAPIISFGSISFGSTSDPWESIFMSKVDVATIPANPYVAIGQELTHFAVRYAGGDFDAQNVKIYRNGVEVPLGSGSFTHNWTGDLVLFYSQSYGKGKLDQAALWSGDKGADFIASLYNGGEGRIIESNEDGLLLLALFNSSTKDEVTQLDGVVYGSEEYADPLISDDDSESVEMSADAPPILAGDPEYKNSVTALSQIEFGNAAVSLSDEMTMFQSPSLTLEGGKSYLIQVKARVDYNAATIGESGTVALALSANEDEVIAVVGSLAETVTGDTKTLGVLSMFCVYTAPPQGATINLWGLISIEPTNGSVDVVEADLVATETNKLTTPPTIPDWFWDLFEA